LDASIGAPPLAGAAARSAAPSGEDPAPAAPSAPTPLGLALGAHGPPAAEALGGARRPGRHKKQRQLRIAAEPGALPAPAPSAPRAARGSAAGATASERRYEFAGSVAGGNRFSY
jgi:hypothetical protein